MSSLDNFIEKTMKIADETGIVRERKILFSSYPSAKMRFYFVDGSYADIFVNVKKEKIYYFWLKITGEKYQVNNYPPHGWHEHVNDKRIPRRQMSPKEFFAKVKKELKS